MPLAHSCDCGGEAAELKAGSSVVDVAFETRYLAACSVSLPERRSDGARRRLELHGWD